MPEDAKWHPAARALMLFNTWEFFFFALVVYGLYFRLPHRGQNWLLLVASYVFYGAWDYRFLLLLFGTTVIDHWVGLRLGETKVESERRRLLAISIGVNLGALGFFKYFNFFIDSAVATLRALGITPDAEIFHLNIILPVGISFYAFQSMSYCIDVYRRQLEPVRSLPDFALYISYFPQLVAGPIERAGRLLPQLTNPRHMTARHLQEGAWLISWGLFKKMVIADNLAVVVDRAFAPGSGAGGAEYLLAVYGFAFQLYCDFSGYSDVARGLANLMGVELMVNFDRPYAAQSVREYWRRWHISLSTWLQDYLFVPLGGSRQGLAKTSRNLMITMLLGGLWHGAAWTFVIWGIYHGIVLSLERLVDAVRGGTREAKTALGRWVYRLWAFHLVCAGYVIFRAISFEQAIHIFASILDGPSWGPAVTRAAALVIPLIGTLWTVEALTRDEGPENPYRRAVAIGLLWVGLIVFCPPKTQTFIYFQF